MAVYRQVHITFWQDRWVLKLAPEERYFYLYLLTNSMTQQCGCYEIAKDVMALELGYSVKKIDNLIKKFVGYEKINYNTETDEVLLRNWLKFNSFKSPKVRTRIVNEIADIKYRPFAEYIQEILDGAPIDSLSIEQTEGFEFPEEKAKTPPKGNGDSAAQKIAYAEHVTMLEKEYDKLVSQHGKVVTGKMIDILDAYKGSTGKSYVNDYQAIRSWVIKRYYKEDAMPDQVGPKNQYKPLGGEH